jgi:hypothetical protein
VAKLDLEEVICGRCSGIDDIFVDRFPVDVPYMDFDEYGYDRLSPSIGSSSGHSGTEELVLPLSGNIFVKTSHFGRGQA